MTSRHINRRRLLLQVGSILLARSVLASPLDKTGGVNKEGTRINDRVEYGKSTLPFEIRSRRVDNNNGLTMHILEAGFEGPRKQCVALLHGFPELAYTWRHQLVALAQAGFHAVAPDLRGYGRSALEPVSFDDNVFPYSPLNRVADVLGLTRALGHEKVAAVIGHDWGAPVAQWCALARPDIFQSVVSMSNPFYESPSLPLNTANRPLSSGSGRDLAKDLAALPRPRKYYVGYYASREANEDMWHAPQGVHDLLRAMYFFKSAGWKGNKPFPLKSASAGEFAKMPTYYVMDLKKGVAETMAAEMPTTQEIAANQWMTERALEVYSAEYARTGFQGGLNSYRFLTVPDYSTELNFLAGRKIEVPACFIGGASDWGVHQSPGAFETMRNACSRLKGIHLVDGAGHSIPEEQPQTVNDLLIEFVQTGRLKV
jgi:pimeloyl-ACP methyl ester carboxylesterase